MTARDDRPGRPKSESLRTLPLDEGTRLADQLRAAIVERARPVLVVIAGEDLGRRHVVAGSVSLGRDPSADVSLRDAGVSWQHALLEDRGDSWVLVDLGSTNGTLVNSVRSDGRVLVAGDRIKVGRTVLRFEVPDAVEQAYDEQVQRLLHVDDLSGLWVRRRFDLEMSRAIDAARIAGEPFGLLVMDLDGIKAINDRHGHLFGAYVIGEAGHVIGRMVDGIGFATRFGGDEFCAALPGHDAGRTLAVGESIRAAIASHAFERDGTALRPGISVGGAAFPHDADDAPALFQRADEALYRAKQSGRNRVSA